MGRPVLRTPLCELLGIEVDLQVERRQLGALVLDRARARAGLLN